MQTNIATTTVATLTLLFISMLSGCILIDVYNVAKDTALDPTDTSVTVEEHKSHYVRADKKKGSLYVYWSSTFTKPKGYLSGIFIYIDGKRTGAVKHNSYTALDLIPGDYTVAVGDIDSLEKEQKISIRRDQNIYFRTGITYNMMLPDSLYLLKEDNLTAAQKNIADSTFVTMKL